VQEFHGFLVEQIEDRRGNPREDLLSGLVSAEEQGDQLTNFELLAVCLDLLTGGAATTTNLLCAGMLTLLRHPEQLEALKADVALVPGAVEEILRYEPPFQLDIRLVAEPFELRGRRIEKGQIMRMALGAANRDSAEFSEPDRFDIRRSPNRHVTFGLGPHFCAGFHLARTELKIAFATLLRRLEDVRPGADADIEWIESYAVRGVTALALDFTPTRPISSQRQMANDPR
jgi:cytochrome P450